jgi:hypothetical protein
VTFAALVKNVRLAAGLLCPFALRPFGFGAKLSLSPPRNPATL